MFFDCVHIVVGSSFAINCCFSDDIYAPRCLLAFFISTHCIVQFPRVLEFMEFFFFQFVSAEFAPLASVTEMTRITRAPQGPPLMEDWSHQIPCGGLRGKSPHGPKFMVYAVRFDAGVLRGGMAVNVEL